MNAFRTHPIAALLGPRQCGKTTLARLIAEREPSAYFDLENPVDLRRLSAPMTALEALTGLVIIDEIQRCPELFELLRVLADRPNNPVRFLVLGSASPYLIKGVSESRREVRSALAARWIPAVVPCTQRFGKHDLAR
jgi:predicted AAA+ superfamily ATPase